MTAVGVKAPRIDFSKVSNQHRRRAMVLCDNALELLDKRAIAKAAEIYVRAV